MSTAVQIFDNILTAMIDQAPTAGQSTGVAAAYTAHMSDDEILAIFGVARAALTVPQQKVIAQTIMRRRFKAGVREGALINSQASVQATIDAANANASALV